MQITSRIFLGVTYFSIDSYNPSKIILIVLNGMMRQMQHFFIGVDGGATKSVVRVEDSTGSLVRRAIGGPANIRISVEGAWQSINAALVEILEPLTQSIPLNECQFHVGMGLAGCEIQSAYQAFIEFPHHFTTLVVTSDAHIACLAAHGESDGAVIIVGTGVTGYQIEKEKIVKVGGWGFPHDDEGGGAWLGLQAVNLTFKWLDGRAHASGLTKAIYHFFGNNQDRLVSWANRINSTGFAELAPIVIQASQNRDPAAIEIMRRAAQAIDQVGFALQAAQQEKKPLPCSLLGGIAEFIEPYLGTSLLQRLSYSKASPDVGAILFVRNHLKKNGIPNHGRGYEK